MTKYYEMKGEDINNYTEKKKYLPEYYTINYNNCITRYNYILST